MSLGHEVIFDLIFVRHGYSCANKSRDKLRGSHWLYPDPELTNDGIKRSELVGTELMKKIKALWSDKDYSICSSQMIRTQETAYYMLAKYTGKKINISPHIAEAGLTSDNFALPLEKQREVIKGRNPDILKSLGKDAREKQTNSGKSNWDLFIPWAINHLDFFNKGSDGIYRAVIFTHAHFLKNSFKSKEKINNNDAVHTVINTLVSYKPENYDKWKLNTEKTADSCPDGCRRSMCPKPRQTQTKKLSKSNTRSNNCGPCQTLRRIKRARGLMGFPKKADDPSTYIRRLLNPTS
jgi:broad specificity phosphatase PhoE